MSFWRVVEGDALERLRELEDGSVQTCVTSPPYFGLRDYGTGEWSGGDEGCDHARDARGRRNIPGSGHPGPEDHIATRGSEPKKATKEPYGALCGKCGATRTDSQVGLEATPDEYVARLVEVFREVRRVLRDDGTLWLNLGDSYAGGKQGRADHGSDDSTVGLVGNSSGAVAPGPVKQRPVPAGYKPKDLLGIPWMVAFALRADGWYLRSDIVWAKPNPMPESVTDRPTKAHEYVFLLSKSPRYFYDSDSIREDFSDERMGNPGAYDRTTQAAKGANNDRADGGFLNNGGGWEGGAALGGRNKRSVWTVATAPFPGAHFAVFPPKLIEPCVKAGSAEDACGVCGAPWVRVVEKESGGAARNGGPSTKRADLAGPQNQLGATSVLRTNELTSSYTVGFKPSCDHQDKTAPSVVLDPFSGAGTTGLVATRLGRSFVGIELNPAYAEMSRERIRDDAPLMNYILEQEEVA